MKNHLRRRRTARRGGPTRAHENKRGQMDALTEVLPRIGAVLVEKGPLTEVLCKPKLLPIKSAALEKAEAIAKAAEDALAAVAAQKR